LTLQKQTAILCRCWFCTTVSVRGPVRRPKDGSGLLISQRGVAAGEGWTSCVSAITGWPCRTSLEAFFPIAFPGGFSWYGVFGQTFWWRLRLWDGWGRERRSCVSAQLAIATASETSRCIRKGALGRHWWRTAVVGKARNASEATTSQPFCGWGDELSCDSSSRNQGNYYSI
jgi:hypothetical protein